VRPQSASFLNKAREFLTKSQDLLEAHRWPDEAGRAAYLACFHAAQALIFQHTGKASKSHGGVQREFARLVKDDPRFDAELRRFLPLAYNFKSIADYEIASTQNISGETARQAIVTAQRFVDAVVSSMS
jgi:uncharacterized protein (UPF0332 family)